MCNLQLVLAAALATILGLFAESASAGDRWGSSYSYSYRNPYLNPYSYESQALPYWLKPGYRSGNGANGYYATPRRPDRFGAIAYSRSTGAFGYSYGHYSQSEAEQDALARCDASDRKVVGWMRNAYGALALGDDPGAYGFAWGTTRERAEQAALAACQKQTTNCYIKRWVFSGN